MTAEQDTPAGDGEAPALDLDRLLAEIDEEVERRRASGELPAELERELDELFARFAPSTPGDNDLDAIVEQVERASFISAAVPVESGKPGASQIKRVLRKLMAWYMNHLAAQVTAMGGATARALRVVVARIDLLSNRVGNLEELVTDRSGAGLDAGGPAGEPDTGDVELLDAWADAVVEVLTDVDGRVLHADCADGRLVTRLLEVGLDAYGVDPRRDVVDPAAAGGLDVRSGTVLEHLGAVPEGALAAVVLSRSVDVLRRADQLRLVRAAAAALAPGGVLVVIGTAPEAWGRRRSPVEADLAPGRPLHPDTWSHLAAAAGFDPVEVRRRDTDHDLAVIPVDSDLSSALNANFARLAAAVFGADSHLVVARKPRS